MAFEQVKLGKFGQWAQSLDDKRMIVLADVYGTWFDEQIDIDPIDHLFQQDQFLGEIVQSDKSATNVFKSRFIKLINSDYRKIYLSARRQCQRTFRKNGKIDGTAFEIAEKEMLSELIFTMFCNSK